MGNTERDAKKWIDYYLKSIRDGERMNTPNADQLVLVDPNSSDFVKEIAPLFEKNNGKLTEDNDPIEVEIAPFSFAPRAKDGKREKNQIRPFWIPAVLHRDGKLLPPESGSLSYPWFLRESLESPNATKLDVLICGLLDDYNLAITKTDFTSIERWDEYWSAAEDVFKQVTGSTFGNFFRNVYDESKTLEKIDQWTIRTPDIKGASKHVEQLYDAYNREDCMVPTLVRRFLENDACVEERDASNPFEQLLDLDHLGQMDNEHPLSPSQRRSLHALLRTRADDILAINGPPGTGKTTLLRHVVANEFVCAALAPGKEKSPPKILASSTNNQAITNILDNFGKVTSGNLLSQRWIGVSASLGTYLASKTAWEKWNARETGVPSIHRVASGSDKPEVGKEYPSVEAIDLYTLENEYLSNARAALQSVPETSQLSSLADVKRHLEREMVRWRDVLQNTITLAESFSAEFDAVSRPDLTIETLADDVASRLVERVHGAEQRVEEWKRARFALTKYVSEEPFWLQLLNWLPIVKKRRRARLHTWIAYELPDIERNTVESVADLEADFAAAMEAAKQAADYARDRYETFLSRKSALDEVVKLAKTENKLHSAVVSHGPATSQSWATAMAKLLDITVRHRMFSLAARFWEGDWVQTVTDRLSGKHPELSGGEKGRRKLLDEMARLTPLFVATCQSVPRFFKVRKSSNGRFADDYLIAECDLIVMDEAGQVSPEIGLAPFFFGKRGLVVGDVFQIEPVWNVYSPEIDVQNLELTGLVEHGLDQFQEDHFQTLTTAGVLSSSGSLMKMAQRATLFGRNESPPGIMLTEHRRCVDEIIQYCNENVYDGRLEPKQGSIDGARGRGALKKLPAMGYVHIAGKSEKYEGSRRNAAEARAIALFLKANAETWNVELEGSAKRITDDDSLGQWLGEHVAVITPFRAQTELIKTELRKELGEAAEELTVGTVHSLQGAERSIILFSPTYDGSDQDVRFFFDRSMNMLNVAVSRAKYHFVAIGDARILNRQNTTDPSALLGRTLFADPENEVSNSFFYSSEDPCDLATGEPWPIQDPSVGHRRISTLEGHRQALKDALGKAWFRVILVSPFISEVALNSDGIPELIQDATERGVQTIVYTDDRLDMRQGSVRNSSLAGRAALIEAGAEVKVCSGIHNKSLAVDERILIEGSFNWLSALRDSNSLFARHEVSVAIWDKDNERNGPHPTLCWSTEDETTAKRRSSVADSITSLINELHQRSCGFCAQSTDS